MTGTDYIEPAKAVTGTFYRYRRFDDPHNKPERRNEERQRLELMLTNREIWFAKPSTLNDPYDCKPVLVWSNDMKENRRQIEAVWREVCKRRNKGWVPKDRNEIARHVSKVMTKLRTQASRNAIYVESIDKRTGVLCLSERWDITQQWTYYAREHTGFCLEIAVREDDPASVFRVRYVDERPQIDMIRLFQDDEYRAQLVARSLLTKASDWSHESEFRAIQNNHGNVVLPEGMFRSITFGMATLRSDIEWIRSVCEKAGLDIPLYQCVMNDRTFAIDRAQLDLPAH